MSSRIDSLTGRVTTGVGAVRESLADGRAAGGGGEVLPPERGLVRERGWRVDLAGPFDPLAPRGTYLDILV